MWIKYSFDVGIQKKREMFCAFVFYSSPNQNQRIKHYTLSFITLIKFLLNLINLIFSFIYFLIFLGILIKFIQTLNIKLQKFKRVTVPFCGQKIFESFITGCFGIL